MVHNRPKTTYTKYQSKRHISGILYHQIPTLSRSKKKFCNTPMTPLVMKTKETLIITQRAYKNPTYIVTHVSKKCPAEYVKSDLQILKQ